MDFYKNEDSFKEASGYTIDGVWYPRVTKIVTIKAKPALYRYYGEAANFKAAQSATQKSAEEGTLVHETVEAFLLGQKPEVDSSIQPAVEAFLDFWSKKNIQVIPELVEKRVVSFDYRYAGTVDAIALVDGKLGVLDIKTSQAIYRDYNLQTAAYMDALRNTSQTPQTRWILKIDQNQICAFCGARRRVKGGREKIRVGRNNNYSQMRGCSHEWSQIRGDIDFQEFPFWREDFEAFLAAKRLWEWENEYWLEKIGYL